VWAGSGAVGYFRSGFPAFKAGDNIVATVPEVESLKGDQQLETLQRGVDPRCFDAAHEGTRNVVGSVVG
jgi:hypothetical protein